MIFLFAFLALWPFASGIDAVKCGPYSTNPYGPNCEINLTDKNPAHAHAVTGTLSDGTHVQGSFRGPVWFIPVPSAGLALTSVKLNGKLPSKKPCTACALAPAPRGIPVPVP